jgi:cytoskeletal protein RodZ
MPEIGSTLREARMRAKIDITEVEHATKIRAKYLRALENEEWNLLPGSTFVKSFLREYAKYLGLDGRLLVEEYKLRFERPSEQELAPISPNLGRDRDRRGGGLRSGAIAPRWMITGALLVVLLVALWAVGSIGGGSHGPSTGATSTPTTPRGTARHHARARTTPATAPTSTSVQIVPTAAVYVCLVDEHGKVLIPGSTFSAGQQVPAYHAKSMRITLGNNQLRLRVNGRDVAVPASSTAIAYALTPSGARALPAAQAPTCT